MDSEEKIIIDLEGKKNNQEYEKPPTLKEDVYNAKIESIQIEELPSFKDKNKMEKTILIGFNINGGEYPFFARPIITKAAVGSNRSNSKLYDFLDRAGLLSVVPKELTFIELGVWLEKSLKGRDCRVLVSTVNKGDSDREYSVVKSVIEFSKKDL